MIQLEVRDGIAEIVLARPKVNAMSHGFLEAMDDAFTRVGNDDAIRGALVRSDGKCFSAGLDLLELASLDRKTLRTFLVDFDRAFMRAFNCPKPVAMAVEGHAIAGGAVLALCADYLVLRGSDDYKIGLTELAVGVPFPDSALRIVEAALPPRGLRQLVYTAGLFDPDTAFRLGVGDALVEHPVAEARAWLDMASDRPLSTFRLVKAKLRAHANARVSETGSQDRERVVDALLRDDVRAALTTALKR